MPNGQDLAISLALDMRAKFCTKLTEIQPLAVSTTKLVNFIAKETETEIQIKTVSGLEILRGALIRKSNTAIILVGDKSINTECWERFTVVKEASHLFLDKEEWFNTDITQRANGLVSKEIENSHIAGEIEAVLAAIELLIPFEFSTRIAHMSNVEEMTSLIIAEYFKVPLLYMEYRMKKLNIPIIR
jgi:Zn-dependent peptidase ImmA (M78 family)